jgi:hypothetical protein
MVQTLACHNVCAQQRSLAAAAHGTLKPHLHDGAADEVVQIVVRRLAGERHAHVGHGLRRLGDAAFDVKRPPHLEIGLACGEGSGMQLEAGCKERCWTYMSGGTSVLAL